MAQSDQIDIAYSLLDTELEDRFPSWDTEHFPSMTLVLGAVYGTKTTLNVHLLISFVYYPPCARTSH